VLYSLLSHRRCCRHCFQLQACHFSQGRRHRIAQANRLMTLSAGDCLQKIDEDLFPAMQDSIPPLTERQVVSAGQEA